MGTHRDIEALKELFMEDLYLTKEEAIAEHRKMWNWIADRLEEHHPGYDIHMYKVKYIKENFPNIDIRHNVFVVSTLNKKRITILIIFVLIVHWFGVQKLIQMNSFVSKVIVIFQLKLYLCLILMKNMDYGLTHRN